MLEMPLSHVQMDYSNGEQVLPERTILIFCGVIPVILPSTRAFSETQVLFN